MKCYHASVIFLLYTCVLVDYHVTCMYVGVLMYMCYLQQAMAIPLVAIRVLHVCRVRCM